MRNASIAVLREIGVETAAQRAIRGKPADGAWSSSREPAGVALPRSPPRTTGFPIARSPQARGRLQRSMSSPTTVTGGATPAQLRADHRLCGDQDPALRLREIPGSNRCYHVDEVGGRGHGHRRTFAESLQKALRSMETGLTGSTTSCSKGSARRRQERGARGARLPSPDRHPDSGPGAPVGVDSRADLRQLQDRPVVHRAAASHHRLGEVRPPARTANDASNFAR